MVVYPSPFPFSAGRGLRGAPSLLKALDQISEERKGESPRLGLCGVQEGPREKSWGRWVRSRVQTWGRAEARRGYLLGALCPMPSVRDICECRILFVPLMLISKAHTALLITGLKNGSCCCVIAFYNFKSVAVI